jgi:hypothetical protein
MQKLNPSSVNTDNQNDFDTTYGVLCQKRLAIYWSAGAK